MKILQDWINLADELIRYMQPGSPYASKIVALKAETEIQLGLCKMHKEIRLDEFDALLDVEPKSSAEMNDQIGLGNKHFDND